MPDNGDVNGQRYSVEAGESQICPMSRINFPNKLAVRNNLCVERLKKQVQDVDSS